MAMTDDKELRYGYFSQTLLPDYIEEHGVDWDVVYDARGTFEEPHTNRRIGCGTLEVRNYLNAAKRPDILPAAFAGASVDVIGPSSGNISAVFFCEKEGFGPLFKAVNLANRYDLFVIASKGQSVTAARQLIDTICGEHEPLRSLSTAWPSPPADASPLRKELHRIGPLTGGDGLSWRRLVEIIEA
jgi:hypothetical protein